MHKFYDTTTKHSKQQNFVDLQKIKHTLQQVEETYEDWVKTQKELAVDPCNIRLFSALMKSLGKTWKFPDTYFLIKGVHKRKYKKPKYPFYFFKSDIVYFFY